MLTTEQKQRLRNVLLQTSRLGYADLGLVDLIYHDNKEEVYDLLLSSLREVNKQNLWYADGYMQRILYAKSTPRMEEIYKKFEDMRFENDKEQELMAMLDEFTTLAADSK